MYLRKKEYRSTINPFQMVEKYHETRLDVRVHFRYATSYFLLFSSTKLVTRATIFVCLLLPSSLKVARYMLG